MRVHGVGVLLTGASGVGKSELALELLSRGHRLIADDVAEFTVERGRVRGHCPRLLRGFIEARSLGILNVGKLYGARCLLASATLDLIVTLDAPPMHSETGIERLSGHRSVRTILGVTVPEISIPIRLGHNLAVLVEAACRDHRQRRAGYRADEDFARRQLKEIRKQKSR
ncbi:HPr Serine kinase C-terminal domain-containing protein [Fontimonas thermophila]|uniref:HPr Serine kinase C-terminal domain-containing protein n=2 Tax=Fontimonas thermophila TaxID=1076937 RepID=A0A1I2J3Q4_9GAMM|nr:HPr Serine kinase C-terminal domain-containing protein [Fontimonas thermophila]